MMSACTPETTDVVTLRSRAGVVEVSKVGAKILSWKPAGGEEVFFCPANMKMQGEEWLHGGMPICWPWFSGNHPAGLPNHGFARFSSFTVKEESCKDGVAKAVFTLKSSDETKRYWPYDFELEYEVVLSDKLSVRLTTRNTGATPFAVTQGLHPYFRLRDRAKAVVRGADGAPYCSTLMVPRAKWNEREGFDSVWKGDVTLQEPHDHVFRLKKVAYSVVDPVSGQTVHVDASGCGKLIVWHPASTSSLDNLEAADIDHLVCAEPADTFGDTARTVEPGGTLVLAATFSCEVR